LRLRQRIIDENGSHVCEALTPDGLAFLSLVEKETYEQERT
jgi:hypothetical protein